MIDVYKVEINDKREVKRDSWRTLLPVTCDLSLITYSEIYFVSITFESSPNF